LPRGVWFGMKWFRRHIKTGSRLALFALAIQLALSFGHFHFDAARAHPAVQIGLSDVDLSSIEGVVPAEASPQQPDHHDRDQHPVQNCAICAVLSLAGNLLLSTPPVLLLPDAVELLYLATDAEFAHLHSARLPFQSRAPPIS
jgi:DUF2946 family protein